MSFVKSFVFFGLVFMFRFVKVGEFGIGREIYFYRLSMASLFSKGKIHQEVQSIAGLDISDKMAIVQKLYEEYKAGKADDETRYEQNFNQLFFNELLGYTWNDHMHPKAGTPV